MEKFMMSRSMSPISDCGKISGAAVTVHEKMGSSGRQEDALHALRFSLREKAKSSGVCSVDSEGEELEVPLAWMKVKKEEKDDINNVVLSKKMSSSTNSRVINNNGERKSMKIRSMVDIYKTAKRCTLEELEIRNGRTWPTEQLLDLSSNKEGGKGTSTTELADEQGSSSSGDPTLESMLARMGKWSGAKRTNMSCSKKIRKRKHDGNMKQQQQEDATRDHDIVVLSRSALRRGKRRRKLIIAESQTSSGSLILAPGQEHRQPTDDEIVDSAQNEAESMNINAVAGPSAAATTTVLRLMGKNIVVVINNTI